MISVAAHSIRCCFINDKADAGVGNGIRLAFTGIKVELDVRIFNSSAGYDIFFNQFYINRWIFNIKFK